MLLDDFSPITYILAKKASVGKNEKGAANGVATLDGAGKVPSSQLPSYVDDVVEYDSRSAFPSTGESGKIYIAKDTGYSYRWTGTMYASVGSFVEEVTVTGTDPSITGAENTRYLCGEVLSLSFTPSATGICEVIFTSGSTPTVLTLPNTVMMPEWFAVEANMVHEVNILDGVYGSVMSWEA